MPIASPSHSAQEPCLYPRLRTGPSPPKDTGDRSRDQGASAEQPRPPSNVAAGGGLGPEGPLRQEPWDRGAGRFPPPAQHPLLDAPRTRSRSRSGLGGGGINPPRAGGLQPQAGCQGHGHGHGDRPAMGHGGAAGAARPAGKGPRAEAQAGWRWRWRWLWGCAASGKRCSSLCGLTDSRAPACDNGMRLCAGCHFLSCTRPSIEASGRELMCQ